MRVVFRSGLLLVLLAQLAVAGPVGAPPAVEPGLALPAGFQSLHQQPGWEAIVVDGTVIIVEDGFTHLRGVAATGQSRWRTPYQPAPRGMQQLFALDGRALMYAGERLLGVNTQSGAIRSETKVPFLTGSYARDADTGCWLNEVHGVCSLSCSCSFQLVSCKDGATIGPHYDFDRICRKERDYESRSMSSSCGCWGHSGTIVGRSGDLVVATLNGLRRKDPAAAPSYSSVAVGVDLRSGAEVWRRAISREPASYVNGAGVTASGRTCWLADAMGELTALDCRSGKTLWSVHAKAAPPPHMPESWVAAVAAPAGIFHFTREGATLYAERAGTPLWSRPAAGLAFAVPRGALPTGFSASRDAGTFAVLEPSTGQLVTSLELERKGAVVFDAGGGQYLVQVERTLRLHDSRGAVLARATLPFDGTLDFGENLVVAAGTQGLAVLDRRTLALRGSLTGWFTLVAVEKTLGARRFVVERYGDSYYTGEQKLRQIILMEVAAGTESPPPPDGLTK